MSDKIKTNFEFIINKFNAYFSDSYYFVIFIISLIIIYTISKKEEKSLRMNLFWNSIVILVLIFNSIVFELVKPFVDKGGVYWRFFWIIPMAPVISCAFTKLLCVKGEKISKGVVEKESIFSKFIIFLGLIFLIVFSGNYVYNENNFQKVNNFYKMPDDILNTIEIIGNDDKDYKKAMIPISVVPWVRQYNANIKIEYNRSSSSSYNKYVNAFEAGNLKECIDKFLEDKCNYIVCEKNTEYDANLLDYNFEIIGENDTYIIYRLNE